MASDAIDYDTTDTLAAARRGADPQILSVRTRNARPAVGPGLLGVDEGNMSHSACLALYLESVAPRQAWGEDG